MSASSLSETHKLMKRFRSRASPSSRGVSIALRTLRRDFAVFPAQGQRGLRRLKSYIGDKVSVGAQMVVVLKAFVERCVSLVLGHPFELSWLDVSQADVSQAYVFHVSSPLGGANTTAAGRRALICRTRRLHSSAQRFSVPSDHRCTATTNSVRCSWSSLMARTGEPGRFAPQIAGSVCEK